MEAMKRYRIGQFVYWYRPSDAPKGAECIDDPKPVKKAAPKPKNKAVKPENK